MRGWPVSVYAQPRTAESPAPAPEALRWMSSPFKHLQTDHVPSKFFMAQKTETMIFSEMLITRHHDPEVPNLHFHRCENIKSGLCRS
jgi:hypothetical protein